MPTITRQQRLAELNAHCAKQLAQFAREADDSLVLRTVRGATPAGDEQRLRGIPALARGVGGTIRGTQPHSALR